MKLLFPNAKHITNRAHWDLANNPNKREKASFLKENFDLIMKKKQLDFIKPGIFLKNFEVRFFHGHTT
ncbi:MBL fold metallo-hydrolase, partial [Flavobacteriales bacterium]|nr:MBL fold metallo-hydrolase [Flavobacteriales bacterium]